jgi:N-succinyldiaminopimelate aminotransferase
MNSDLALLHRYPFEKLAELKQGLQPPEHLDHIALSVGEPRHPAPHFVIENLIAHLHQLSNYPSTKGSQALREAIAAWVSRRFAIKPELLDPETSLLPVSGTREALFAIAHSTRSTRVPPCCQAPHRAISTACRRTAFCPISTRSRPRNGRAAS